jgi:hypothetical protein
VTMADEPKLPIQIDVGARAEAKLEIRTEVPKESSGRLVDAFTDVLRPFSERRGLKADLIRLQREEVAIRIAQKARERRLIEGGEITPVPTKILVPLLEQGSLEDNNDEYMIDRWADLLATASTKAETEPRFVGILSELSGSQAQLLEKIATHNADTFENPEAILEDASLLLIRSWMWQNIVSFFREEKHASVADIYEHFEETIERPGAAIIDLLYVEEGQHYSMDQRETFLTEDDDELDLEILSSFGLVERVQLHYAVTHLKELTIIYYHLTALGIAFIRAVHRDLFKGLEA